jgi:hypothetical protein
MSRGRDEPGMPLLHHNLGWSLPPVSSRVGDVPSAHETGIVGIGVPASFRHRCATSPCVQGALQRIRVAYAPADRLATRSHTTGESW